MKKIFFAVIFVFVFIGFVNSESLDSLPIGNSFYKFDMGLIKTNEIISTSDMKKVDISGIVRKAENKKIVIIGEFHTSYKCHDFQKQFLEAFYKKYENVVIGMEFFNREDNDALEEWRLGKISEEELLRKTGWYKRTSMHYGYTKMIMDVVRKYKIKVIGLNVKREIVHKISRKGFNSLTPDEKRLFPTIRKELRDHRYFIKMIFGNFALNMPLWFENMYTAQKSWDIIMAKSMVDFLKIKKYRKYKGIIVAGSAHVEYGLGIPFRVSLFKKKYKVLTIVPVYTPDNKRDNSQAGHPMMKRMGSMFKPASSFSRGIANIVFGVNENEKEYFIPLGISGKSSDKGFVVSKVSKNGYANNIGIKKGDIIISFNGKKISSLEDLRILYGSIRKNERPELVIKKNL